jgi:hypothetical protein
VEVGQEDGNEAVKLVEVQLEHGQLRVEKLVHAELLNHRFQHRERLRLRPPKHQEQETCYEVHTLAIIQRLLIHYRVTFQYIVEILWFDIFEGVKRTVHVDLNRV